MKQILRDFDHKKGVHSDTTALRDIFAFEGHRFPEEFFFGLGEGLGFYYWNRRNLTRPMIGGRCGNLELDRRVCDKLGARLVIKESSSPKRARETMLSLLMTGRPVMLHTDAYYLKFLRCSAHFGAHSLVVAGIDGDTAYVADRSRDGLIELSYDELSEARSSPHRPFPPQNRWFEIDIPEQIDVDQKVVMGAIGMNATEMLNSPVRNVGIGGIYYFANCVRLWGDTYDSKGLGRVCREAHDAIEGDGIGGGCFRFLYADFLRYAGKVTGSAPLAEVADGYRQVGNMWSQMAKMFTEVECGCTSLTEISSLANTIAAKEHELQVSLMTAANLCCRRH